jgi:hypothetical protein
MCVDYSVLLMRATAQRHADAQLQADARGGDGGVREKLAARVTMDAIFASIVGLYSTILDLAAEWPKLTGTIFGGAFLTGAWAYWKRPIINVRFGKKEGSHAGVTVDFKNAQGEVIGRVPVKYFRMRIKNIGWTTIKGCSGQLIKVTRRVAGRKPAIFDGDEYHLGWAHHPESATRDIQRRQSHQMDLATLVLQPRGPNQLIVGGLGRHRPNNLSDFLDSYRGKATYTLDVLVSADNARPRQVSIEVAFDPPQDDLTYIPFNTRAPWWRLWWWLRVQWSR